MRGIHNPIVPGWYADPEARTYQGRHWIYATRSFTDYKKQMNLDAFSSDDLVHWKKHESIVDLSDFPWVWRAVWAPTIIEQGGRYYLIFASNDIQADGEPGSLEIAVADHPAGPFRGYLGRPLVDRFIHGAKPIDTHLFKDTDGTVYLYYGGWSHCNVARMNAEMNGFIPFADGALFHEITPPGYVEGPCMLKRDGTYYFMWSSGGWHDGSYHVSYAVGQSPTGPFKRRSAILQAQPPLADGPGHHGWLYLPETDDWLIVYHRRIPGDPEPGNRFLCIDRLEFEGDRIRDVVMTESW